MAVDQVLVISFIILEFLGCCLSTASLYGLIIEWKAEEAEKRGKTDNYESWSMFRSQITNLKTLKTPRFQSALICLLYSLSALIAISAFIIRLAEASLKSGITAFITSGIVRHVILILTLCLLVQRLSVFDGTAYEMRNIHKRIYIGSVMAFTIYFTFWNCLFIYVFRLSIEDGDRHSNRATRARRRLSVLTIIMISTYSATILSVTSSFAWRLVQLVSVQNSYRGSIVVAPKSPTIDATNNPRVRTISDATVFDTSQQQMLRLAVKHITLAISMSVALLSACVLFAAFRVDGTPSKAISFLTVCIANGVCSSITICVYMSFPSANWLYFRLCGWCDRSIAERTSHVALRMESQFRSERSTQIQSRTSSVDNS